MMKSLAFLARLLGIAVIAALCASCTSFPGADGRYATHDRGSLNRENRSGLPVTPYEAR